MLSVNLSPEELQLLEKIANQLGCSTNTLAEQAVKEFCLKLTQKKQTAYELGQNLFGKGELALTPIDPLKKQIWEKLYAKHGGMD